MAEQGTHKPLVGSSNLPVAIRNLLNDVDYTLEVIGGPAPARRIATPVDWAFAPEWLTLDEALFLSGFDGDKMRVVIAEGGVDLNDTGLIAKDSLYEYRETLVEVLQGCWG